LVQPGTMATGVDHGNSAGALTRGLSGLQLPGPVQADFDARFPRLQHPYNLKMRALLADELLAKHCAATLPGSYERAHLLLKILDVFYPTQAVSDAYFENLEALLAGRRTLDDRGKVILGIGTGRCGSTSLAVAFRAVQNALATHETPPMIFWEPQAEQIGFHMKRLDLLARYFPVVFDASHWWLNVVDVFLERFPEGKIVGLHRDTESCVSSFLKMKGTGPGTLNHWATLDDKRWLHNTWDPCYPSYAAPPQYAGDTLRAKGTQIQWYVESYNRRLYELALSHPDRVLLVSTDMLGQPQVADDLSALVNVRVSMPVDRYNASTMGGMESIGQQQSFWV